MNTIKIMKSSLNCSVVGIAILNLSGACDTTAYAEVAGDSIIYVDSQATGSVSGTSWADAYNDLQDALAAAVPGEEIWVATGVYTPDAAGGARTSTFQLKNGVEILGGFAGTEQFRSQRDVATHVTTLSGDLNSNDGPGFANNSENVFHIVTGSGTNASAVLDGFHITEANADGPNGTDQSGAGMLNDDGSPSIRNCTFRSNSARGHGAGMLNLNGSCPMVENSRFISNISGVGAAGGGSGMFIQDSSPVLINCLFLRNEHVGNNGASGGIYVAPGSGPRMINCTFTENTSTQPFGGAIFIHPSNTPALPTIVTNCVLWGDQDNAGPSEIGIDPNLAVVSYSCIEGGFPGTGNINVDPELLVTSETAVLSNKSPCLDAGNGDMYFGPLNDVQLLSGIAVGRFVDLLDVDNSGVGSPDHLDMGAYELSCAEGATCRQDINGDGVIDVFDLLDLLAAWGACF